ncbi:Sec-independent protein translocase subunit TatA [Methylomonas albis]|jgi:sec-independent protein translocase protein TatA|uniref:Sec-independent protein translocase protein TatA n=1 Tax=Methylomonas albis TaxID=1854563 RepID=A0ABR9D0C9_9GAMM|nr:Sec-independent protein translocase subunit TatA [Methylomonas albis]MBD9356585.1 Sec-independent protein translocase subunit TatA [Methylomonas albis]
MGLSIPHLLVVLAIVILVFGTKRLKSVGADLGDAIKGFRTAVKESEEAQDTKAITQLYQEELSADLINVPDRNKA